jgi:lysophospholipase L1-like esterase
MSKQKPKTWKIVTIGDSLTQGNAPPEFRSPEQDNKFQAFLYRYLKAELKNADIDIWNYGIGGQIIGEIIARVASTLPADIVIIMGGTNDAWRYSHDEEMREDVVAEIIEQLGRGLDAIRSNPKGTTTMVVACSVPPVADKKTLDPGIHETINIANEKIAAFCEQSNIFFCDVNEAMRLADSPEKYADPDLVVPDGVHFTPAGNKACGEAMGKCVAAIIKSAR